MKVAFIAGPFRGKNAWEVEQNIRRAEEVGFEVAKLGIMPLIPHTNTRFFDGTLTDEFWLEGTQELLKRADMVVLTSPDAPKVSEGTFGEVELSGTINIPVYESVEALKASINKPLEALSPDELIDMVVGLKVEVESLKDDKREYFSPCVPYPIGSTNASGPIWQIPPYYTTTTGG